MSFAAQLSVHVSRMYTRTGPTAKVGVPTFSLDVLSEDATCGAFDVALLAQGRNDEAVVAAGQVASVSEVTGVGVEGLEGNTGRTKRAQLILMHRACMIESAV